MPNLMTPERKSKTSINAQWKSVYLLMFNSELKKNRRTISQIQNIRSNAKIYCEIYSYF
jgi:hypothetical protein